MSARIERPEAAALVGGALVMLGASLPWLTLFAGLQQYRGLLGVHGQILFAGGALAIVASVATPPTRRRWFRAGTGLLGLTLIGFIWWLLTGLFGMLHEGLDAMLVPRAGPGLFVSLAGATLITLGPALASARRGRLGGYRDAPQILAPFAGAGGSRGRLRDDRLRGRDQPDGADRPPPSRP